VTIDELKTQIEQLNEQQKQAEVNFHQITGAIAATQQLLEKAEAKESGSKEDKKDKK
jgi:outer membrane murein-binding lipoprotein Lpp|tara:strand:+ start:327 stop:497 length:171 start_codon:yes stop_codon:yes gene_type:complete